MVNNFTNKNVYCIIILCYTAFPSSLAHLTPLPSRWGDPYTAECQYQIGLLSQYYSLNWTVVFSDGIEIINSNTTSYQLHGSSLTIATFTPLVESLVCRIEVTGVPPFQGQSGNLATQTGFLVNIGVHQG